MNAMNWLNLIGEKQKWTANQLNQPNWPAIKLEEKTALNQSSFNQINLSRQNVNWFVEVEWFEIDSLHAVFDYDNSNSVKEYLKAFDNTKCYANGINVL